MERWQKSLLQTDDALAAVAQRFNLDLDRLQRVAHTFRFRVSPYYLSLIQEKGDPIYLQCIPDERELSDDPNLLQDPLGEETHALCPGVVKRYPDRCMFYVANECATYCRFCTRKRLTGCASHAHLPTPEAFETAYATIAAHPEIRDVLVSGGDPFLLPDAQLDAILTRLRVIPHIEIIRIGTRTPCTLPERITPRLVQMLKKHHPLFINVHFNHPRELTPQSTHALTLLADAGIPLGSQTVLLKDVNDNPETLKALMLGLLRARVRPYYLFHCDLIYGTSHFRVPIAKGLDLIRSLRSHISGLAVPHYVIDLPNGKGKIPLSPDYLVQQDGPNLTFRNYLGELCPYPDLPS